jgi:hypothetical protein
MRHPKMRIGNADGYAAIFNLHDGARPGAALISPSRTGRPRGKNEWLSRLRTTRASEDVLGHPQ